MFKRKRGFRGDIGKHKFCPICRTKLEVHDTYCTTCGYSFHKRNKRRRKGIKWKNVIFAIIIIAVVYFSLRYFNGQSIIPSSIPDALNFTITKKG